MTGWCGGLHLDPDLGPSDDGAKAKDEEKADDGEKNLRLVMRKAAANGHHVAGTPYNWRHNWQPLNAQTARRHGKPWRETARQETTGDSDRQPDKSGASFAKVDAAFRDGLKGFTDPYNMNNVHEHDAANQQALVEAKKQVAQDLTRRMLESLTDKDFGDERYWQRFEGDHPERQMYRLLNPEPHQVDNPYTFRATGKPPPPNAERVDPEEVKLRNRENEVARLVSEWAKSNNDDPIPYAYQQTAAKIFNLENLADWKAPERSEEYVRSSSAPGGRGKIYEAFLRAQHAATQEWFARHGITHVKAYRGFRFENDKMPAWTGEDSTDVPLRPLSSFSVAPEVAETFAFDESLDNLMIFRDITGGTSGAVIEESIPVERILAFPRTGMGALSEGEIVVLGGTHTFTVRRSPSAAQKARATTTTLASSMNEDWLKVRVWDVRDAEGKPIETLEGLATHLGVSLDQAREWLRRRPAGQAAPFRKPSTKIALNRHKAEGDSGTPLPPAIKYMLTLPQRTTGIERPREERDIVTLIVKKRAFREADVRRNEDGEFAEKPGGNSRFATRADDARRSQGQTRSNFVHPRTGAPMGKTETGDTYESLFEAKGASLLEARYGGKYEAIAVTGGWLSRNTPLDFKVGDRGGELKSLSSTSLNQKTAIKKEEVERKQKAVAEAGLKPLLVVQVIDQTDGTVQVYAFEEFASKAVKKMEHLGSYSYSLSDFEEAQKRTGHHDKAERRAAAAG